MREDDTGDLVRGDGRGSWRRVEKDDESRIFLVPAIFDLVFTSLNISHEGSSSLLAHWRKRLGGLLYFGFGTRTIAAAAAASRCPHTERGRGRGLRRIGKTPHGLIDDRDRRLNG